MTTTQSTAPGSLDKDTYTGRHTRSAGSARVGQFRAERIAQLASEGVIWESFGHVGGVERFSRSRYVADVDGSLFVYSPSGSLTLIHPADRVIRILFA